MSTIILVAPNGFTSFIDPPEDQCTLLQEAFDDIRQHFHFVERKVKDDRLSRILRELVEMSYEAFGAGDRTRGCHLLGEFAGLIWPSRRGELKHVVEAERRATGKVEMFSHVVVTPYPYEGTLDDLGADQGALYALAKAVCDDRFSRQADFKTLEWVMSTDGVISALPKKSRKATDLSLRASIAEGSIRALLRAELSFSGQGLICYDSEEKGRPAVSIRSIMKNWVPTTQHVHLLVPRFFELEGAHAAPARSGI